MSHMFSPRPSLVPVAEADDEVEERNNDWRSQKKYAGSDDEYDTDMESDLNRKESFDGTGRKSYYAACRKYKTNVVSYFLKYMQETEINMPYHGIGIKGAKAISIPLVTNTVTIKLNLRENSLFAEGAKYISEMLKENCYITDLDLSTNYLGREGCKSVCNMLQHNINLKKLNLSNNEFGDHVGDYLLEAFKNNDKLEWLDLSGNDLGDKVGLQVGPGINANDALEYLNLSWNQFRAKPTQEIAMGLRANCTIKIMDLSWNSFSNIGAIALGDALKVNNTLVELNISDNRIGLDGALALAKSLETNNTLEVLKLDGNNIMGKGAHALLSSVLNKSDSAITELHMKGVFVQDEFIQLYESSKEARKLLVIATFQLKSPLEKLQDFIKINKSDWLEAFEEADQIQCSRVTVTQFKSILEKLSFKVSLEEMYGLLDRLKKDSRGLIKYRDPLLGFEREYVNEEVAN